MKVCILFLLIPLIWGCSSVNKFTLEASQQDLKNAENSRKIADNLMSTWSLNSGWIQCAMTDTIPPITLRKVQAIDKMVKEANRWSKEDYQKGCFLGLETDLATHQAEELLKKLIPLITRAVGSL